LVAQNILINAQSGTEEPLSEPVKHMIISKTGTLLKIVNMDELVDYGASHLATHTQSARAGPGGSGKHREPRSELS
jgi:hypothetical protein